MLPVDITTVSVSIVVGLGHSLKICRALSPNMIEDAISIVSWRWNRSFQLGRTRTEHIPLFIVAQKHNLLKPVSHSESSISTDGVQNDDSFGVVAMSDADVHPHEDEWQLLWLKFTWWVLRPTRRLEIVLHDLICNGSYMCSFHLILTSTTTFAKFNWPVILCLASLVDWI